MAIYSSWEIRLEDALKTSSEDVWLRQIYLSWSRRLEDVLKMYSEDEDERCPQEVFIKTNVCYVMPKYFCIELLLQLFALSAF